MEKKHIQDNLDYLDRFFLAVKVNRGNVFEEFRNIDRDDHYRPFLLGVYYYAFVTEVIAPLFTKDKETVFRSLASVAHFLKRRCNRRFYEGFMMSSVYDYVFNGKRNERLYQLINEFDEALNDDDINDEEINEANASMIDVFLGFNNIGEHYHSDIIDN